MRVDRSRLEARIDQLSTFVDEQHKTHSETADELRRVKSRLTGSVLSGFSQILLNFAIIQDIFGTCRRRHCPTQRRALRTPIACTI